MEEEKQLTPLDILELQTQGQTDFSLFLRYLAQDGISLLQSTRNPLQTPEEHNAKIRFLIGFLTARVLFNRSITGLVNDPFELLTTRGISAAIEGFMPDKEERVLLGQGVAEGFAIAGIFPENWQGFANPDS